MSFNLQRSYKKFKDQLISINWQVSWDFESRQLSALADQRTRYPKDPIYNSLFQQKAQDLNVKVTTKMLFRCVSAFLSVFLILKYVLKRSMVSDVSYDAAYFYSLDIVPIELTEKHSAVKIDGNSGRLLLGDVSFLFHCLFLTRFNFALFSVSVYRCAQARYAISKFGVSKLWVSMEYSASCGVLKRFCESNNVQLINFMHGEKVLTARDSFCSFHKYYVWTEHHAKLLKKLNCDANIIVSNPYESRKMSGMQSNSRVCYFLKGGETAVELKKISSILIDLEAKNYKIYIKTHPRRSTPLEFTENFDIVSNELTLEEIISENDYLIAQYSTVLLQAWLCGNEIVVDDISNAALFGALEERSYLFSAKNERAVRLSRFLVGAANSVNKYLGGGPEECGDEVLEAHNTVHIKMAELREEV